jgi:hypothetical protein
MGIVFFESLSYNVECFRTPIHILIGRDRNFFHIENRAPARVHHKLPGPAGPNLREMGEKI